MLLVKHTDNTKLLERVANHLDCHCHRYHLNYEDAKLVASVWLAYKVAEKEEHFPRWLEVAVAEDLISPYFYRQGRGNGGEHPGHARGVPTGLGRDLSRKPARQK